MTTTPPLRTFHSYEPRSGHGLPHDPFNAIVGPRPIGWISTQNAAGALNLAPYSFFNAFNYVPPIVGFASIGYKDTVRNIEAIVIDSSALVRRLGNFHSFDLVLKNTADMALALPALELSLTDTRDEVISRRVFLPEEWPDAPALLPAQDSVTVSFRLSLALGDTTPMAGYRALVFYP